MQTAEELAGNQQPALVARVLMRELFGGTFADNRTSSAGTDPKWMRPAE